MTQTISIGPKFSQKIAILIFLIVTILILTFHKAPKPAEDCQTCNDWDKMTEGHWECEGNGYCINDEESE